MEQATNEPPDLVLLDVVMPDMNGLDVCKHLRENPATAMVPIVILTASGEQEKIRAIESGADDFIPRPFNRLYSSLTYAASPPCRDGSTGRSHGSPRRIRCPGRHRRL